MQTFKAFIKNPKEAYYYGEDKDEKILYIFRSSLITTLPWIFFTAIFIIVPLFAMPLLSSVESEGERLTSGSFLFITMLFWYLFTFGFFFQSFLNWYFNVYVITNKKIVDMDFHGVLYKNISEATLRNVEAVTSSVKGTLGIIFNVGDVIIQTAAENPEFEFVQIDNPSKVRDIIADLVASARKGIMNHDDN